METNTQSFVLDNPQLLRGTTHTKTNTLTIPDTFICTLTSADETVFDFNYIDTYYKKESGYYLINDSITIKKTQRLEKNYLVTFDVFIDGEHTAEFATNCRTSKNSPYLKYKAINDTFCSGYWREYYFQFTQALGLELYGITDFHIAHDTNQNTLSEYKNLFLNSTIITEGTQYAPVQPVCVHMLANCGQFVISPARKATQATKAPKSDIRLTIYDKTQELEISNKPNINALHKLSGLEINKPIFRNELRIGKKPLKGVRIEDLNQQGIESLYRKHAQNLLSYYDLKTPVIQPNGKAYDKNRNYQYKRIDILDLTTFNNAELQVSKPETEKKSNPTQSIKTAFKINFNNYIIGQTDIATLQEFIACKNNYLVSTPTHSNDLETENRLQYQHLTKKCIDGFLLPPNPEIFERLGTIQQALFNNDIPPMQKPEPEFNLKPRAYSGAGRTVPKDWDGGEFVTSTGGFNQAEYMQMLKMIDNKYAKNDLKLVA
ncbi:hypothetical protein [Adhaeribacter soli]|uniref:Uncharacterized protein n=1 Tax=Adhaeribacter soli TaxID=2607655 RepID=A0A5N1IXH3_9BACT|nr:hypothetical protein [Adhaeribacter soli]KAA9338951.1 hypothetical protein F0P94_09175 [Adhaeribacter soli]